jgi:hypothetical protein
MDEDDANEALLESLVKELNVRVATLSEVPPDDISRLDEPVLDVAGASRTQFDVDWYWLAAASAAGDIVWRSSRCEGARLEQLPKHLEDEDSCEEGPVKWEVKF